MKKTDRVHKVILRKDLPQGVLKSETALALKACCRTELETESEIAVAETQLCRRRWSRKAQETNDISISTFLNTKTRWAATTEERGGYA